MPPAKTVWLSLADVARRLGVSRSRVSQWVLSNRVKHRRIAGKPFVREQDCIKPEPGRPGPKGRAK